MKTLNTIQSLAKIGKILSKIIFIFCIVGFCCCIAGIISTASGVKALNLSGISIESILSDKAGIGIDSIYASLTVAMILCAGEGVLAKFAEHYFKHELADGTPFTLGGAKELQRLGILTICIPLGSQIIAEIVHSAMAEALTGVAPISLDNAGSVALGIMFIVMSLVCRYGAEKEKQSENEQIR